MPLGIGVNRESNFTEISSALQQILDTQLSSGEIPWFNNGKSDPWDHIEAAMGLVVGGYFEQARRAFKWLATVQLSDGSWYSAYHNGKPIDKTRETNMSSYISVGLLHYYLSTGDIEFLKQMRPCIKAALSFTIGLQTRSGQIFWAISPEGEIDKMSLLTGSSSIFMSLKCALRIFRYLGEPMPVWQEAMKRLGYVIEKKPQLFNMTKSRFAMDWYYPILAGVVRGAAAQKRIENGWNKFVITGHGVRCVADRPWVTIAETCELILALSAMGRRDLAWILFDWVRDRRFADGSFWCGYTLPDMNIWPGQKMSWTNAIAALAADALFQWTPAATLFERQSYHAADMGVLDNSHNG